MPCDDLALSVRGLGKTYRLFGHPGDRVKQFLSLGTRRYHREFTALEDVSFDIRKGETVGIIGRNGSGKSTLLQLLCGILKPTTGSVTTHGRVAALLELGAGFNPEFTGRENVYFQGAVMGFTRAQMDERFDAIAAFADIGGFMDQPVRTYSSGMFVRLAFAVAAHADPEILVIDEALAVGDAGFQAKCFRHMEALRASGATILFVSHATEQITRLCNRALLLEAGRLQENGEPNMVVNRYLDRLTGGQGTPPPQPRKDEDFSLRPGYHRGEYRWGGGGATILDFVLRQGEREFPTVISSGEPVELAFLTRFEQDATHPVFGLTLKSRQGITLFGTNSDTAPDAPEASPRKAGERVWIHFTFTPWLHSDEYFLSLGVVDFVPSGEQPLDRRYDAIQLTVRHPASQAGMTAMNPHCRVTETP